MAWRRAFPGDQVALTKSLRESLRPPGLPSSVKRMEDVMNYKTKIDAEREAVLDQLIADAQEHEMGDKR